LAKRCEAVNGIRVYLCGRVMVECAERIVSDSGLAGRQGRLLFAYLMSRSAQPVSRTDLMRALWGETPPPSADTALNAILSKLRGVLRGVGVVPPEGISCDAGTYRCAIQNAWIDLDAARTAIDRAEGAWRAGDPSVAWTNANVAATIARRPFLPDEQRPWVTGERERLARVWRRATLVLADVSVRNREFDLGVQHAAEALAAEPFDETACRALMRAHAAAGNRAEALRVYAKCRQLFRDELGSEPSPETAGAFLSILRSDQKD
jgi:SARP family transcriptional regulator, regulator of embCAB operon